MAFPANTIQLPTTRAEFKEYCLRRLGKPVIEINVSDDQVDDRIDDALMYFWEYHHSGSEKSYYKHVITANNITDGYITMPEAYIGVTDIFDVASSLTGTTANFFNIQYQIALNDLYTLLNQSIVPYYVTRYHLEILDEIFVGKQPIRYNRNEDKLYLDIDWDKLNVGDYIIITGYKVIDPADHPDVWSDRWLLSYATAQIKYQWGANLSKFDNIPLPGGVILNGDKIKGEAEAEIEMMEKRMLSEFSLPPEDMTG